ncbi:MAG TPA: alpha/beta fold hydrolase [Verrucomicrobiae bacterium]|nr:alpha/beta fold hydrolase [Verrucomicrobiae bacterium]
MKEINSHGVIAVEVSNLSKTATNYALALSKDVKGTNEMVGFQVIGADGLAIFLLRENRTYALGAFSDLNGNGMYDSDEPAELKRDLKPTPLSDLKDRAKPVRLTLTLTNDLPRGPTTALPRENPELGEALPIALGEIADLDQPKFSSAAGEAGMWKPFEFMLHNGIGVYFLEPYTPKKKPVIFVYGISGSAQDWRKIFATIDRDKYQLWLFQYPSGLRLDKSANALSSALLLLKQHHKFETIDVVAHSMGGLVSRGAIQRTVSLTGTNFIPHFVTISTPWGGHQAAELAVKHLNFPVPSWRDMAPDSDYLKEILSRPLPPGTRHDMLFSYKSSGGIGLPSENDGVVSVPSQLLPQVQDVAASVLGVYADHMGILASPITLQRLENSLAR